MGALAAVLPALISGGTGILSNLIGGSAADKAARQQRSDALTAAAGVNATAKSTQENIAGQVANAQTGIGTAVGQGQTAEEAAAAQANKGISDTTQRITDSYSPYTTAGSTSLPTIQQLASQIGTDKFSFNPTDLSKDPGYAFTLDQGQKAIQRSAAAQGGLFGTGTMKSLAGYTTGTANQYFNDAYNRALSTFNTNRAGTQAQIQTLQQLAGMGLTATQGGAGALQTSGLAQGANVTTAAKEASDLGYGGAVQSGSLGLQGGEFGGTIGMQASKEAGDYLTNASNASANATLAGGRANQGIVGSVGDLLTQILKGKAGGNTGGGNVVLGTQDT